VGEKGKGEPSETMKEKKLGCPWGRRRKKEKAKENRFGSFGAWSSERRKKKGGHC